MKQFKEQYEQILKLSNSIKSVSKVFENIAKDNEAMLEDSFPGLKNELDNFIKEKDLKGLSKKIKDLKIKEDSKPNK